MNDKQPEAYAVPLHELLVEVPRSQRLEIEFDEGRGTSYIPVGRYCHEAAAELRRLHEENEALRAELAPLKKISIKNQRDAAWAKRDMTKCICDHIEYCVHCYPIEFREGGYWDQQEAQGDNND